jgi:2-methylcitrate dehydratase PrpD
MDPLTQQLAAFATDTTYDDLPQEVIHETKRLLLDSIGCALGATRMERGKICTELAKSLGGTPEATILGTAGKVSSINAAFANGELISTLDYDALYGVHTPPFVIPAPLAVAETVSASGKDLILALTLGHEIARRLQMATPATYSPKESGPEYGKMSFAPVSGHGTSGFGAAIGAGSILKLNVDKMANAMGIAGYTSPPSTFRKWTDTVPCRMTKYGPPGFTAEVGVRAALLADRGYYGDTNIFEGEHGYWRFTGFERWNKDIVVAGLGSTWKCREVNYKKYPCGH